MRTKLFDNATVRPHYTAGSRPESGLQLTDIFLGRYVGGATDGDCLRPPTVALGDSLESEINLLTSS